MRKLRNKFGRPRMIWDTDLIAEDKAIINEYGLRRKREIWAVRALVSDFRRRARELNAIKNKEKADVLLQKINKLGFMKANSLDDVLSLQTKNVLDRRLQTIVLRKGFAKTAKQARQIIVHGHVTVDGRKTTFPSYLVPLHEEPKIEIKLDVKKLLEAPEQAKPDVQQEQSGQQPEAKPEGVAKTG